MTKKFKKIRIKKKRNKSEDSQQQLKNIRNKRIVVFSIVIILVIIYSYFRLTVGGYNTISKISDLFNNNTVAVIFFIGFLYTFRNTFRLNQPDIATITKICLMLLSAFFSFHLLVDLHVPSFLAMSGGLATVLGIQQTTSLGVQLFYTKRIKIETKRKFWINAIVIVGITMALTIDIVTTFYNLVLSEGKDIRTQQLSEIALKVRASEKLSEAIKSMAKADSVKAEGINELVRGKNFENARIVSRNYAKDSTLTNIDINKFMNLSKIDTTTEKRGRLELGFARIVGDKRAARMNFWFMIAFSISLTMTIMIMEIKEELEGDKDKKKLSYGPKEEYEGNGKLTGGNGKHKGKYPKGTIVVGQKNDKLIKMTQTEADIIDLMAKYPRGRGKRSRIADELKVDRSMVTRTCQKYEINE